MLEIYRLLKRFTIIVGETGQLPAHRKFSNTRKILSDVSTERKMAFTSESFCPYSYFDPLEIFQENQFPPINHWTNNLNGNEVYLNETDYAHVEKFLLLLLGNHWATITTCT